MPINVDLLIAAPVLQDYLTDKDGTPMAGGTITCYQDNSRTTLKNWYYQSGTPGNYTYIRLPNPLTLSAAGTICDINGVDTIPFFYPYSELDQTVSEPYYITIVNFAMTNQITRANFPFISSNANSSKVNNSFNNLIINNGFWRNFQPNSLNITPFSSITLSNSSASSFLSQQSVSIGTVTTLYTGIVAPSQHDGFSFPDVQFVKNNLSANETCTFTPFPLANSLLITKPNPTNTPEYYISHVCTNTGSAENYKCYQFPIALHINNLANVNYTVSIQAQNGGSAGAGSVITLKILQFTGTGTTSPVPFVINSTSITTTTGWANYTLSDIFPASSGLTLGNGSDDAFYLQVWMPLNTPCTINFTKPSLYLTPNIVPSYDFQTYDEVDAIINSPRTGDLRTSVNSFYPYGWVPMNDGVIGLANPSSSIYYARANSDTWPLFNLLWNLGKPYDTGSNSNAICQMFVVGVSNVPTNYGASAYSDFIANKAIALTALSGRVMMGTVPMSAVVGGTFTQGITATNSGGNLLINGTNGNYFFQGQPIAFSTTGTLPGGIVANAIYYVTNLNPAGGGTFNVAPTYATAISSASVIAFSSAGSNSEVITNVTGVPIGEYGHVQVANEVGIHNHTGSVALGLQASTLNTDGATLPFVTTGPTALTINNSTGGARFNITQTGAFYNIYIKL